MTCKSTNSATTTAAPAPIDSSCESDGVENIPLYLTISVRLVIQLLTELTAVAFNSILCELDLEARSYLSIASRRVHSLSWLPSFEFICPSAVPELDSWHCLACRFYPTLITCRAFSLRASGRDSITSSRQQGRRGPVAWHDVTCALELNESSPSDQKTWQATTTAES